MFTHTYVSTVNLYQLQVLCFEFGKIEQMSWKEITTEWADINHWALSIHHPWDFLR
jgi:hypothetical protein